VDTTAGLVQSREIHVRINYRPVLSSESAPRTKKTQMFVDNFRGEIAKFVAGPRWWPDTRTDWPTDRRA
jgi:hypothetical protein